MNIKSLDSVIEGSGTKILVYGNSGIGKTLLCASLKNPLIISAENGLLSLSRQNLKRVYGDTYKNTIGVVEIKEPADIDLILNDIETKDEYKKIRNICIDSLSEILETLLFWYKKAFPDGRQAYGAFEVDANKLIRRFRDLPGRNVYFSAKLGVRESDSKNVPEAPWKKITEDLPYFFDEVFKLDVGIDEVGKKFRFLRTNEDGSNFAKDRSGCLSEIEPANLEYIFEKIKADRS